VLAVVWVALAVGIVTAVAGISFAAVRALHGWRAFRRTFRTATAGLAALEASASAAADRAASLGDGSAKLSDAVQQLERSLAGLRVLTRTAGDVRSGFARVRGAVPRK
jgi:hypothetical protein